MSTKHSGEQAVRTYLRCLENPDSLIDRDAVRRARSAAEATTDPIERVLALEEVRRLESVDLNQIREAFITDAKRWADAVGVHADTLARAGVPSSDLEAAGFELPSTWPDSIDVRLRRVTVDEVIRAAEAFRKPFTTAQLVGATGASIGTVRKAMRMMLEDGRLHRTDRDPDWTGRGAAPQRFQSTA